ncbi:MAG: hypothetical protein FWG93_01020 [Oscillospiraceae bacterium]|nr:hypothetical protein [Oscillospiraceae bacterium]
MLIHRTGPHITLYIDGAEATANGWGKLDEACLRRLAEEATAQLGLASAAPRVIEAYPSADGGALVFVRFRPTSGPGQEAFYAFDGADALLDALRLCGIPVPEAGIYRYQGRYILAAPDSARLCEFGVRLRAGARARAMLEEQTM